MKIAIADSCTLKFCGDIRDHWIKQGHEVKYEPGASEILAQWADLYYMDWWDNNIHYLWTWYNEHPEAKKPKFCVRPIDIDIWQRGVRCQPMVDWIDNFICIAPHMFDRLNTEHDGATGELINWNGKLHMIRCGVNMDKFTLKQEVTDGFQVGMVLGDLWWYKNHMAGLDIFKTLTERDDRWRLHIRGQHESGDYNKIMFDHYLKSRGIEDKVILYPPQPEMNQWYEKIDYLLHPGMKETFCYAVAEACAKGIPCVVNNFYGSDKIWPTTYNTHEEAVGLLLEMQKHYSEVTPETRLSQRNFIERTYGLDLQLAAYDKLLGT
jgi:hypothetical protein